MKKLNKIYKNDGRDRLLPRYSLFIFDRSRTAAILWLFLAVFGVLSYTTWLKRAGFPSVNIPFSIISGSYVVKDSARVDHEVAQPIDEILLKDSRVKSVHSEAMSTRYVVQVQYKDGTDAIATGKQLQQRIIDAHVLPTQATVKTETPKFGFTQRGDDAVVSVYSTQNGATAEQLAAQGTQVAQYIVNQHIPTVKSASTIDPFVNGVDPATGRQVTSQISFDRFGERANEQNKFYDAISVGVVQKEGADVIKFDGQLRTALQGYNDAHKDSGYGATLSASYAPDIKDQIGELQRALLEGLVAVLIVGSIVIAIRASFITVISMFTVLSITLGIIYLIGYTLNTITLFALILCLGLVVDDTIIMGEAIDAQRRRHKDPRETIHVATRKVSRAMVAATSTAILSFSPLLFVGGILGSFIRAIPVTVIISLLVSLVVSLTFIPLFARYLLLGKKQMGNKVNEPAAGIEAKVAHFVGMPMLWARSSKKRLFSVGIIAVVIGLLFVGAAGFIFQKVTFNIFPPSKDTNGLTLQMGFPQGTTIAEAEAAADRADNVVAETLGSNFKSASYFENANTNVASLSVYIISYNDRSISSPELVNQLQKRFDTFSGAQIKVGQQDVGPPASAFTVNLETTDRQKALALAADMNKFLAGRELTRVSGTKAKITTTSISNPGAYERTDGKLFVAVTADFDATDTTTLVTLAKEAVNKEFTPEKLATYGLPKDVINYDLGQEQQNQDSFKTLALAFPIVLVVIFFLLALEFRSLLQPLLIFMAIPFSLFGITLGLYLTHNAFSFFAMLGFFALIGLSIKNTILLTDYANQLRHEGASAIDAAVGALGERFRPLIATSLTAVVSLLPLTLSSPFWQGLTVVLICGLLSSTFMVITVFPYYYLGAEYMRIRITRTASLAWLILTGVISFGLIKAGASGAVIPLVALVLLIAEIVIAKSRRKRRAA
ncbi:MAG TPA: efflux RND transporter permease subunit [Patescibacteria group bacterium]|nr:efflux RND transporter permease subunit [Patescibacteria group bacterium]